MNEVSESTIGHNIKARAEIIQEVCRKVSELEAKRKQIGADISELKNKRIKGDLSMKIGDFNIAYRLYNLEGDARDELLDTVRETFNALGVGEQLDWLQASERADSRAATPPTEMQNDAEKAKELAAAKTTH